MLDEGERDLTASAGWLDQWKKRHSIMQLEICSEKLSTDLDVVEKFCEKFMKKILHWIRFTTATQLD